MSKVSWNIIDMNEEDRELDDSELPKDPPGYVASVLTQESEAVEEGSDLSDPEESLDAEQDQDVEDAAILSDARRRLEQGRLYEMIMTNDIFTNMDADPQAIKNVQREVKRFAKERMEIMLGMKRPVEQNQPAVGQFNHLEVEVLKSLANKLSGGASSTKSSTLTPISANSTKTTKASVKAIANKVVQSKSPKQEQKAEVASSEPTIDPALANKKIEDMTYDEKLEYNRQKSALYNSRKVVNPEAIPMPSIEAANAIYSTKALTFNNIKENFRRK